MIIEWLQRISEIFPDKQTDLSTPQTACGPAIQRRVLLSAPATLAAGFVLGRATPESTANLSFEELTKLATGYAAKVREAATALQRDGYLLEEDVTRIVGRAASVNW